MFKRVLIAAVMVSSYSPICVSQTIVYDNLLGNAVTDASPSDLSAIVGGETLDDVTLANTTRVTGVNWSGVYSTDAVLGGDGIVAAANDDFEIRIYSDNAGTPEGPLLTFAVGNAVNRTLGAIQNAGGNPTESFDYSAEIDFTFDAGTTYWMSFLNNTSLDPDNFSQSVISTGGNATFDFNPGTQAYVAQGFITDFQLTAVPEPSSLGLLGSLVGAALLRRRRT